MRLLAGRSWDAWAALTQAMDLTRKRLERARALVPQTHSLDGEIMNGTLEELSTCFRC